MTNDSDEVVVTVTPQGRPSLTLLLGQSELVMGRDCEGLLIADSEVSRRHLRLRRRGIAVEVADLGSTNGTFLDGSRLVDPQLIDSGARLTIGDTTVDVRFRDGQADTSVSGRPVGQATEISLTDDLRSTSIDLVAGTMGAGAATPGDDVQAGDTITMVFSDIESSTERAAGMGDTAWYALLDEHNRLFRSTLHRWGGKEIKSIGDGFMMSFPSARRALRFTSEIQRRVEADDDLDLRVRMGLHTGEAIVDVTGDLFGRHVNLAARVANLATGGQILASLVVHEIAAGQDDIEFGDPMLAELKGFEDPQAVYEVLWDARP